jgi:hypothetical protein
MAELLLKCKIYTLDVVQGGGVTAIPFTNRLEESVGERKVYLLPQFALPISGSLDLPYHHSQRANHLVMHRLVVDTTCVQWMDCYFQPENMPNIYVVRTHFDYAFPPGAKDTHKMFRLGPLFGGKAGDVASACLTRPDGAENTLDLTQLAEEMQLLHDETTMHESGVVTRHSLAMFLQLRVTAVDDPTKGTIKQRLLTHLRGNTVRHGPTVNGVPFHPCTVIYRKSDTTKALCDFLTRAGPNVDDPPKPKALFAPLNSQLEMTYESHKSHHDHVELGKRELLPGLTMTEFHARLIE